MGANTSLQALILSGALQRLSMFFQSVIPESHNYQSTDYKQLTAAFNSSNDSYNIYEFLRKQKNEKKQMPLPFLALTLDTMSVSVDSAKNSRANFRMGHYTNNSEAGDVYAKTFSIPTSFDCSIKFLTDDFWQMLAFCSRWLIGTHEKNILNYLATWNSIEFSTKIDLSESVTFPAKDNTLDMANLYEFNGTLKIHGFVGAHNDANEMIPVAALKQINVVTGILPEGYELADPEILKNLKFEKFTI